MGNRRWNTEEREYLRENWGNKPMRSLCKALDRTEHAIIIQASRMHLGPFLDNGDYITFCALLRELYGSDKVHSYTWYKRTFENKGLKIRKKRCNKSSFYIVKLADFWKFAEENRSYIDFSRLEKNALGYEPDWVDIQRGQDRLARKTYKRNMPWSDYEIDKVRFYVNKGQYSAAQIGSMINRSEGAVLRKIYDLNLPYSHKKASSKGFSEAELEEIKKLILQNTPYEKISELTGRTDKSLRGMLWQRLKTESPDKVRKLLQNGAELAYKPHNRKKVIDNEHTSPFNG